MWKRLACQMCVSSHLFFLWRRLNSSSRSPCRRRALRLLHFGTSFFFFVGRHGSRLVLWLMARLLMCLGSAPKTWLLLVVLVAAFIIVLTSDARAAANAPADEEQRETGGGREFKMSAV
ncbi:hypothetical protein EYF80_047172 [Liparis tanakae]|uniref:Uncharacterized protein n=1 Tax=Liparis tanakae TaxID=230148 RepID=A0A4Z2FN27_9TELE|nr:hypothetical protein EYF80_047172 [Liparis tanakae]